MKSPRELLLCLALLSALSVVTAQNPEWLWARSAGGTNYDYPNSIAVDSSGNTYVTGYFEGNATFGSSTLTSGGNRDIFVAKLDSSGYWLWAQRAGGIHSNAACGVAVDSSANVYLTGSIFGTASFGSHSLTSSGGEDIFVAKLDSLGNWLWAARAGGTDWDVGNSIAVDSSENAYLTGYFRGSATFGGSTLTSSGDHDIFVAKLDGSGNWLWASRAGGTGWDIGFDIAVDSFDGVYLTGPFGSYYTGGTASFGNTTLTSNGQNDIYVAKLDCDGNWLWAQSAGGTAADYCYGIAVDGSANAYLTGRFQETASFGSITLTSNGAEDIFVAKLNSAGNWLWASRAGGPMIDYGYRIALDSAANAYVIGTFYYIAHFGSNTLTSRGETDIFVAKLDSTGNWIWAARAGGTDDDEGIGIALDSAANVYLGGCFHSDSADFGSNTLSTSGYSDIFVAKLAELVGASDELNPPLGANTIFAWPNPFKQTTTLNISLDKPSGQDLRVSLYDLRGRRVRTLACELSGRQDLTLAWDGRDDSGAFCPNGIYLVKLFAGQRQLSSAKVTLIR